MTKFHLKNLNSSFLIALIASFLVTVAYIIYEKPYKLKWEDLYVYEWYDNQEATEKYEILYGKKIPLFGPEFHRYKILKDGKYDGLEDGNFLVTGEPGFEPFEWGLWDVSCVKTQEPERIIKITGSAKLNIIRTVIFSGISFIISCLFSFIILILIKRNTSAK
jgi:hypothetical protein